MKIIPRNLMVTVGGAVVCAFLSSALFIILAVIDGTRAEEAVGYGIIVGVIAAFIGGCIGVVIGIINPKVIVGGIVGFLATVVVVGFYVLSNSRPGQMLSP